MKPLRILTIDDDIDFANAIQLALESQGHGVTVTHHWLSFMRELSPDTFDAIVADVETPTGNGIDAISFLCKDPAVQRIPKAFVTGRNDAETIERCRSIGSVYLHKSPNVFLEVQAFVAGIAECENQTSV